jgi:hypothetical protein
MARAKEYDVRTVQRPSWSGDLTDMRNDIDTMIDKYGHRGFFEALAEVANIRGAHAKQSLPPDNIGYVSWNVIEKTVDNLMKRIERLLRLGKGKK